MKTTTRIDLRSCKTVTEVAEKAHLNYRVTLQPVYVRNPVTTTIEEIRSGQQAVVREDTGEALSIVGSKYTPVQTMDFLERFAPAVGAASLRFVSCMSVDGGRAVILEAELPEPLVVKVPGQKDDVLRRRLLYTNSFDGSTELILNDYLLRQICTNGATMMLGMEAHSFRHTASVTEASSAVIVAVSDSNARFAKVGERAGLYAATKFTAAQMRRVAEAMYPSTSDDPSSRLVSIREDLVKLFSNGRGNHGQNAWDALNAVTEWDSHHRNVRGSNKELSRLKATFLGLGHAARGIEAVNEIAGIAA